MIAAKIVVIWVLVLGVLLLVSYIVAVLRARRQAERIIADLQHGWLGGIPLPGDKTTFNVAVREPWWPLPLEVTYWRRTTMERPLDPQ